MELFTAERIVSLVAILLVLFLVGRGLPGRRWPLIIAATLAVVLAIVLAERSGMWPRDWTVR